MDLTPAQIKAGRRWAYAAMLIMLTLSVAGNLSHTFLVNPAAGGRAQTYAVMWPLLVWFGVELFARIPWRNKRSHSAVRWGGVMGPALIAGIVSYNHLSGLLKADKEDWIVYTIGPLAVDGLMLMSTLGLLLTRSLTEKPIQDRPMEDADTTDILYRARIAELERQIEARDTVPFAVGQGQPFTLADVLPEPVSPAAPPVPAPIAIGGVTLPEPTALPDWPPVKTSGRAPKYDVAKAKAMITAGALQGDVATTVGVNPKTIQRLRAAMIKAGELPA